ncbi:ABC transporter substrate-binding protein [Roseofilum acuticapitatum]
MVYLSHIRVRVKRWLSDSRLWAYGLGVVFSLICAMFMFLGTPAFTQTPVPVKVLIQAIDATHWQPLVTQFNQTHPNIQLQVVKGPNNTNLVEDLYTSAFLLGDSPYDLVYMDIVWVQKFAAAGWLADLSDRMTPEELNVYLQGDIEGGRYQGKLYRIPFQTDGGMLYYRRDLLEQIGAAPPETFAELMTIAKTLQERNLVEWGYVWQGKQYEGLSAMFVEILAGYGGFWIDPQMQAVGLDEAQAIAAVEFLRDTLAEGISPPGVTTYSEEETRRLFQNGKAAFLRNWPYVYSLASDSDLAGKFAIKPMMHTPGNTSGACLGGWGLGMAKSSQHPDAAWQAIEYFNQPEVQRQYFQQTGYVPARRSLFYDSQLITESNYLPRLLPVLDNSVLRPPIPQYAQASDILQRYLSAALTGRETPQRAMELAAKETRVLLSRGGG